MAHWDTSIVKVMERLPSKTVQYLHHIHRKDSEKTAYRTNLHGTIYALYCDYYLWTPKISPTKYLSIAIHVHILFQPHAVILTVFQEGIHVAIKCMQL